MLLSVLLFVLPVGTAAADPYPFAPPAPKIAEAKNLSVVTDNQYARDRRLLATVSPNGDGYRDLAYIRFFLTAPAQVTIRAQSVQRNFQRIAQPKWFVRRAMLRGWQQVTWRPSPQLEPTTYAVTVWVT